MKHATEEELFAYRERDAKGREAMAAHLKECAECRAELARLEEVFAALDAMPIPDPGEDYGTRVWRQIAPRLVLVAHRDGGQNQARNAGLDPPRHVEADGAEPGQSDFKSFPRHVLFPAPLPWRPSARPDTFRVYAPSRRHATVRDAVLPWPTRDIS